MNEEQIKILLQSIDSQIAELNKKVSKLQIARKAFIVQHKEALTGYENLNPRLSRPESTSTPRRLGQGTPKKWVIDALTFYGRTSASELNQYIERRQGRKLAAGTLWRVLKELKESGKARNYLEDATWEIVEVVEDNGLPF